jgi:hypothetical protein
LHRRSSEFALSLAGTAAGHVSKPVPYVGGELNSVVKNWDAVDVRWCLSYPDVA